MAKRNDYITGREDGLLMALEIVKNEGVEALEKEIEFRNITGIRTALAKKDINRATIKIKEQTVDTVTILSVATLHDEFGFGTQRCDRFIKRFVNVGKDTNVPSNDGWIPVEERLPEDCEEIVLVQVSGKPADNILFDNAFEFALYEKEEGWMLDNYPEWKNPDVIAWQSLPKPYRQPKKEKSSCKEHIMSRFMKVE